ncbi:MAG: methyltransferase [Acidimicrobiaceae bacterium]|nr:methyltransferase [Acidimicrobiaceae bacterium]
MQRYRIQFPTAESEHLDQDEVTFDLHEGGETTRLRFHDYDEIYRRPGLYEQIFYDRLQCRSPAKVASILRSATEQAGDLTTTLRVLDLGAGNGIMAEELRRLGTARIVGVDIIQSAADACERDRWGLYDDYVVCDLTDLDEASRHELEEWSFDCLTTVAAIGFGDIPPLAFVNAFNLIRPGGWVAFNIKQTFLEHDEHTDFSTTIRELVFTDYLEIHHLERYRHRLSIDGEPIFYYAIAGKKTADVPLDLVLPATASN